MLFGVSNVRQNGTPQMRWRRSGVNSKDSVHQKVNETWTPSNFPPKSSEGATYANTQGTGVGFMAAYSATRCARSQNHLLPGRPKWCHGGIPGLKENWNVGTLFHLHVIFHFFDAPTAAGPWISDDLKVFFWKIQHVDDFWTTFNQVEICKFHRQIFGRWSRWTAICYKPSVWWIVRKGITSFHVAINVEIFTRTGTTASRISVQKILMSDIFWIFLVFLSKLVWETTNMDLFLIGKKTCLHFLCSFVT